MGDKSKINWCDATWNPVTGCTKVSSGCLNCYAEKMAKRLQAMGAERYRAGFDVQCHEDALEIPLRWKRPRKIFVNSMSDLFHDDVPFDFIDKVFAVMALATRHTFMILTKRPVRMMSYVRSFADRMEAADKLGRAMYDITGNDEAECHVYNKIEGCLGLGHNAGWPLRNVWLGVTVEDRKSVERISHLLRTPAARRFVSCEPLVECVSLSQSTLLLDDGTGIDWVIVGGESGPKARPMDETWVKLLRSQARHIGAAFFFKQWGSHFKGAKCCTCHKSGLPYIDGGKTYGEFPKVVEDVAR